MADLNQINFWKMYSTNWLWHCKLYNL